ncbi:MAG: mechanosensitive ion channel family protein [Alphaproteobacteria bacterium]|nr:mechanosensitive ion channel family protein [Alphaproteobacteria bacterium SS10]
MFKRLPIALLAMAMMMAMIALVTPNQTYAQDPVTAAIIGAAAGGGESAPEEPTTTEEARDTVARLSDQEVRERLLAELDAKLGAEDSKGQTWQELVTSATETTVLLTDHFVHVWNDTTNIFTDVGGTLAAYGAHTDISLVEFWSVIIFSLAIGLGIEAAVRKLRPERRPHQMLPQEERLAATMRIAGHRLFLMTLSLGIASGIGTLYFGIYTFEWRGFLLVMAGAMIIRVSRWSSQFFQLPDVPEARLTPVSTYWARFMVQQTTVIAAIGAAGFVTYNFRVGVGMIEAALTISFWIIAAMFAAIIYSIWRGRHAFTDMIMAGSPHPTPTWTKLAKVWPWIAMILAVGEFLFIHYYSATGRASDISIGGIFLTLMILLFLPPMLNAVVPLVAKLLPVDDIEDDTVKAKRLATRPPVERIGRIVMLFVLFTVVAALWNVDLVSLLSLRIGSATVDILIELFWIGVGTFLIWQLFDIWLNRMQAADEGLGGAEEVELGEMGGQGGTRLATNLPLFRKTGHTLIAVTAILVALSELGVNIAPFIAGFGIIGLALGFGAQTLVRDVVSGLFFLIDDAFRIGEYVDIGGTVGTVEKISARSLRLRHHRGPLHTVPYGEIAKLTNYSRDWVIVKLKFRVPFDTEINKVKKIFKQIGRDLLEHEELGKDFIQPFKSQGVFDVDDSAIIVRGKFMSKPGKQFLIKREVYVRVQKAFEENGIEFARRSVIVQVAGEDAEMPSDEVKQKAAIAAAEQAMEEEQQAADDAANDDFAMAGDGPADGPDSR